MPKTRVFNLGSLNLRLSPFLHKDGELIRAINVERDSIGAWKKRSGHIKMLGTADGSSVTSLFSWMQNDSDTFNLYRRSGSVLYYSTDGTGAWTVCGNGTFSTAPTDGYNSAITGREILDNTLIVGDGVNFTRHSPAGGTFNGTNFGSTAGAPLANNFQEYQGRIYAARGTSLSGTSTDLFFSTTGTASDWITDSSSIRIPGEGRINSLFKSNNRLIITKDLGQIFRWDGFNLEDTSTNLGPSSPRSIVGVGDFKFYFNDSGFYGYGGNKPELISNPIQSQIYSDYYPDGVFSGGVSPFNINNVISTKKMYKYMSYLGDVTDSLTKESVSDCLAIYDYQLNEWTNWILGGTESNGNPITLAPTAMYAYREKNMSANSGLGVETTIFGDANGQVYKFSGTATSDDGVAIESLIEGVIHLTFPESDKKWDYIWAFTNPGCQAKIQVGLADTFTPQNIKWLDLKQTKDGVMEMRFPAGAQSKLLFWKLYEKSSDSPWQFYGFTLSCEIENIN